MPVSESDQGRFDRDAHQTAQDEFDALGPHLSDQGLQRLAEDVLMRLASRRPVPEDGAHDPRAAEVAIFLRHLTEGTAEDAAAYVESLIGRGYGIEEVYLVHLAGAAHTLGRMWTEDQLSFSDVTLASSRIYAILRGLRSAPAAAANLGRCHAVFAAVPGEEHTLGVSMAAELFRRRGWEIDLYLGMTHDRLISEIERSEAMLIGLSGAGEVVIEDLARTVVAVRAARPEAYVLIAGQIVREAPDAVRLIGADALASDAVHAERKLRLLSDIVGPG